MENNAGRCRYRKNRKVTCMAMRSKIFGSRRA